MEVLFYNMGKRKNSTALPGAESESMEVKLKNGCSMLSPIFLLNAESFGYNYCKFNDRYYWIDDIRSVRAGLYEVSCSVDALASWKKAIIAMSAMVERSASDTDQNITDPENVVSIEKYRTETSVYPEEFDEGGSYILATMSGSASDVVAQSFSTLYGLNAGSLGALAQEFNSEDVYTILKQFMDNPLDTIVFCRCLPVPLVSGATRVVPVKFGTYESSVTGTLVTENHKSFSVELAIPWQKDDFRAVEPYTTGSLYLPGVGDIPISLAPLRGLEKITIQVTLDYVSNGVHYALRDSTTNIIYGTFSGSLGVDIPISSVQSGNVTGVLAGVGTGIAAAATGRYATAVAGFAGAGMAAFSQTAKSTGAFSGGYNVKCGGAIIRLSLTRALSIQEPSEYLETIGNPCMKVRNIGELSGYCKTRNFQVKGTMTAREKDMINSYMDGGVYIE